MSEDFGFEDDDVYGAGSTNQAHGQSNAVKALREKAEADSKKIGELTEMVNRLQEGDRRARITNVLEQKGVNPKVAQFYKGDAEPEQINTWLAENADVFGLQRSQEVSHQEAESTPHAQVAPAPVSLADQQAFLRMQAASIDGVPPSNENEIVGSLNAATSMEELLSAMQRHGWNG